MSTHDTIVTYTVTDDAGMIRGRGMREEAAMGLARNLAADSIGPAKFTVTKVTHRAETERVIHATVEAPQ